MVSPERPVTRLTKLNRLKWGFMALVFIRRLLTDPSLLVQFIINLYIMKCRILILCLPAG